MAADKIPTSDFRQSWCNVPRGQSSRYTTGVYRADSPLGTEKKGDVEKLDGFQYENISFQEDVDGLIHVKVDSEPLFDIARKGTKWIGVYKRPKRPEVYMDLHDFVECLLFYLMRKEHSMKDWRLFTGFSRA